MSCSPIARSPDLRLLLDEGHQVRVEAGWLVVDAVPYVDGRRRVRRGRLLTPLALAGGVAAAPGGHHVHFDGDAPHDVDGAAIPTIPFSVKHFGRMSGPPWRFALCLKPVGREFADYHEMVTAYVAVLGTPVATIDPSATVRPRPPSTTSHAVDDGPFAYMDTASSRSGTDLLAKRLAGEKVGIVGLGGTGSYVLDLLAKTPVAEIRLMDHDHFLQHNAFRAPGAPSLEELAARPTKVGRLAAIYSRMHLGVVPHAVRLGAENLTLLDGLDFVFLCLDDAGAKPPIIARLEGNGTSFIDVGMGLEITGDGLVGTVRTTTSTPAARTHVDGREPPLPGAAEAADAYAANVQVADLNALNAALAVIRWKRLRGFYRNGDGEHQSAFLVDGNTIINAAPPSERGAGRRP